MIRRALFPAAGAAATSFASSRIVLAQQHEHTGHAGHTMPMTGMAAEGAKYPELAQASAHCVLTGQDCLRHCLEIFAAGEKECRKHAEHHATCRACADACVACAAACRKVAA